MKVARRLPPRRLRCYGHIINIEQITGLRGDKHTPAWNVNKSLKINWQNVIIARI